MKGKLNKDVSISDNETLLAGTYVEILDVLNGYTGIVYQCKLFTGRQFVISSNKVDITDYSPHIDWEQRRYELAKSAMQGYCIALGVNDDSETYNDIAIGSIRVADALIKELKKGD